MSERGAFVTEYIGCGPCLTAANGVLLDRSKSLCSTELPTWFDGGPPLPIIAGKIGGVYPGQELDTFEDELNEQLAKVICHPLRIAVLAEEGERIFTVMPNTPLSASGPDATSHQPEPQRGRDADQQLVKTRRPL